MVVTLTGVVLAAPVHISVVGQLPAGLCFVPLGQGSSEVRRALRSDGASMVQMILAENGGGARREVTIVVTG